MRVKRGPLAWRDFGIEDANAVILQQQAVVLGRLDECVELGRPSEI
jgi:hypothetical protein